MVSLLTVGKGWKSVECSASNPNVSGDFSFMYNVGASGADPTAEYRAITLLYSDLCEKAYQFFGEAEDADGVNNLRYLNNNPNKNVRLGEATYAALKTAAGGGRYVFLAPYYDAYQSLFLSRHDFEAQIFDPYYSRETAALFDEVNSFVTSDEHVSLSFFDNNEVRLDVSEQYLAFAGQAGISSFVGLGWMSNAFIIDYIADRLILGGYTCGYITSADGFTRCLGNADCTVSILAKRGAVTFTACNTVVSGRASVVRYNNFPVNAKEGFYVYEDEKVASHYIDVDGRYCAACSSLTGFSSAYGCGEIVGSLTAAYIAESVDINRLSAAKEKGVYAVYVDDTTLYYNNADIKLTNLYSEDFTLTERLF